MWEGQQPTKIPKIISHLEDRLTPREMGIALYDLTVNTEAYEGMGPNDRRFVDLSQSIGRSPSGWNMRPVVTPGARTLVVKRDKARLLHPFEALRLQGLSFNILSREGAEATADFTGKQLQHLAGNAFSSNHVCVAAIISLLCLTFQRRSRIWKICGPRPPIDI